MSHLVVLCSCRAHQDCARFARPRVGGADGLDADSALALEAAIGDRRGVRRRPDDSDGVVRDGVEGLRGVE